MNHLKNISYIEVGKSAVNILARIEADKLADLETVIRENPEAVNYVQIDVYFVDGFCSRSITLVLDKGTISIGRLPNVEVLFNDEFRQTVEAFIQVFKEAIEKFTSTFPEIFILDKAKVDSPYDLFEPFEIVVDIQREGIREYHQRGYKEHVKVNIPKFNVHNCVVTSHEAILELSYHTEHGLSLQPLVWEAYRMAIRGRSIDVRFAYGFDLKSIDFAETRMPYHGSGR